MSAVTDIEFLDTNLLPPVADKKENRNVWK
jgi:hypothetical protein